MPRELCHLGGLGAHSSLWVAVLKRSALSAACAECQHCSAGESSLAITVPPSGSGEEVEAREVTGHPCEAQPSHLPGAQLFSYTRHFQRALCHSASDPPARHGARVTEHLGVSEDL